MLQTWDGAAGHLQNTLLHIEAAFRNLLGGQDLRRRIGRHSEPLLACPEITLNPIALVRQ